MSSMGISMVSVGFSMISMDISMIFMGISMIFMDMSMISMGLSMISTWLMMTLLTQWTQPGVDSGDVAARILVDQLTMGGPSAGQILSAFSLGT